QHQALQQVRGTAHRHRALALAREAPTLLLRHGLEEVRHLARHGVEADDIRAAGAGFDGAQREQIRRHSSEPLGLLERVEQAVARKASVPSSNAADAPIASCLRRSVRSSRPTRMPISLQPMPGAAYQMIRYAALPTPIVAYRVAGTAGAACRASAGGIVPEAASTRPSAAHMRTNFPSPKARSAATRVTAREKSPALAASPSSVSVSPSSASAASMGSHTA